MFSPYPRFVHDAQQDIFNLVFVCFSHMVLVSVGMRRRTFLTWCLFVFHTWFRSGCIAGLAEHNHRCRSSPVLIDFCCSTSTAARRPIGDGDEWEKGGRRVKSRNRRQPGRPSLPWTAA